MAEFERLVAVFETDTSRALAPVRTLDTATTKLETTVTKTGKSLDRLSTSSQRTGSQTQQTRRNVDQMTGSVDKLDKSAKHTGKTVDDTTKKLSLLGRASNALNQTTRVIGGRAGGMGGDGLLPGLANISSIIRGIPQIGQLAGAIIRPLTDAAEEGIRLNWVLEQAEIGFTQVAGSADKARGHIANLMDFGKKSPFRFEGLLEASRLMTAMGFSIDEQIPKLRIWGAAIASSGELSAETVQRVVLAMGQMRMAGRVNAQDMLQLTNANIPGWQLLAKAIGKTVAETRKMAEAGKLNGKVAVEAMTQMMAQDKRYKGMLDKLQGTGFGRLSAAQDIVQFAQATAMKGTSKNISNILGDALSQEDFVNKLAAQINVTVSPATAIIESGIKMMLTGGISEGINQGIGTAKSMVKSVMVDFATDSILGPVRDVLGWHSAATAFIAAGEDSARGYLIGWRNEIGAVSAQITGDFESLLDQLDELNQSKGRRFLDPKIRSKENLDKLIAREPDFMPKLISGAQQRGMNPDHLLNVMAVETAGSFNPAAKNPTSSASGLIQFMASTAKELGTTTQALRQMSATTQLDYVFKYFDHYFKGKNLSTQGAVYSAVGTGKVGANDESIVMQRGNRGYEGNKATWDRNLDGFIRQGEMAISAFDKLGAGVNFTVNGMPVSMSNPVPTLLVPGMVGAGVGNVGSLISNGAPVPVIVRDIVGGASSEMDTSHLFVSAEEIRRRIAEAQGPPAFADPNKPDVYAPTSVEKLTTGPALIATTIALRPMIGEFENLNKELDTMDRILSPDEWFKRITAMGGAIQQLGQYMDSVETLGDLMTKTFVSIPERFGDIVGDSLMQSEGKFSGFLGALRRNILSTFQQVAIDIVKNQATRAAGGLLSSLLGKQVYNEQGDPTGEIKGGSGFFRKLLGFFGIQSGALPGDKGTGAAIKMDVAATKMDVAANKMLTASQVGGVASAATGGKGGGILGTLLNIGLGALGMSVGGALKGGGGGRGGTPTTPGASPTNYPGAGLPPRAFGGPVRAGQSVMVGDHPFGLANPEIFTPMQDGMVTPANGAGRNFHLHVHNHFPTRYGRVPQESSEQAAMRTVGQVDRYHRRRGHDF